MDEPSPEQRGRLDESAYQAMCARAADSNLDPTTLLATDYLNHFNEIVMLLEMVADMPEIMEDVKEWGPKSYKDHFRSSTIADRDIAIEAYDVVPPLYRDPFDVTVQSIDSLIAITVKRLDAELETGNLDRVRETAVTQSRNIQRLMDSASAIIHGASNPMDQSEIDAMMALGG